MRCVLARGPTDTATAKESRFFQFCLMERLFGLQESVSDGLQHPKCQLFHRDGRDSCATRVGDISAVGNSGMNCTAYEPEVTHISYGPLPQASNTP
ncbi:protein of unknown function [Paraburkholderia kururiensis]